MNRTATPQRGPDRTPLLRDRYGMRLAIKLWVAFDSWLAKPVTIGMAIAGTVGVSTGWAIADELRR